MDPYADIPELSAEAQALARRRKIAEAMMAQSQQPLESMGQAGGAPVPISWTQGLAKMAQAYFAGQQGKELDTADKGLATQRNQMEADAVKAYQQRLAGTPEQVNALPPDQAGPPQITPAVPATPDQRRQAIVEAMAQSKFPRLAVTAGAQQKYDEADAARTMQMDQRRWEVEQRGQDKLDQIEAQAREGRISRAEADQRAREAKQDMIRLTAAMRAPAAVQPLVPIVGPDGKQMLVERKDAVGKMPAGAGSKAEAVAAGKTDVDKDVMTLKSALDSLNEGGGITSTAKGVLPNVGSWMANTGVGQTVGSMGGTTNQKHRDVIAQARPLLLRSIMQATGMSAKQLDSNAELKLWLSVATDPTKGYEANTQALSNIAEKYGSGGFMEGGGAPASPPSNGPPPGAVRLKR
ncbi:MAG: hypothetical protein A3E01_00185 [Gammaproteobacteria bacterium RIFCSPHIGHO2_12_FULL_63_22]|nr:MAG: hypothetical protein A3E01_00185 [Gammaproteobacteria bacterium RIFCSPHIGHO2_12_FULL_63_22]